MVDKEWVHNSSQLEVELLREFYQSWRHGSLRNMADCDEDLEAYYREKVKEVRSDIHDNFPNPADPSV